MDRHAEAAGPTDRLRIALVTDFFPPAIGGVETQVCGLADALAACGHHVRVITSSLETDPGGRFCPDQALRGRFEAKPTPGVGFSVDRLGLRRVPRTRVAWPTPAQYRVLRDRLAAARVDVVHAHGAFSTLGAGAVLAARSLGLPSVTTHHSLIRSAIMPFAWLFYGIAFRHATTVTAVSAAAARDAARASGRRDVVVVPNGIAPPEAHTLRNGVRGDGPIHVVSVMRLKLKKRPYQLLTDLSRVAARVRGRVPVRFTIVGDGPERARLDQLCQRLGLQTSLTFAGEQPRAEIDAILSDADVSVSSSPVEAFGLALLEARRAGVPAVAMRGGGVADVVADGTSGVLASTSREFVDALVRVISDPALRSRLAAGSQTGIELFFWERVAAQYVAVYRRAIADHAAGTGAAI